MSAYVLVVDDDPSICDLLVDLLEAEGYRVGTALDGEAALALAVAEPPDLLIADLWMPRLDGQGLAAALAAHGLATLPLLFISGMPRPASVPLHRFIAKPFDLTLLVWAVEDALSGKAPQPELAPDDELDSTPGTLPLVLVVEDDPETRGVVHDLIAQAGYRVVVAATGAQAIVALAAADVDLILLDLVLPDMSGLELCLRVRARDDGPYLPIVMLTALGSEQERHAGFTAGADDYVVKPFRAEELLDRVGVWVRTRQRLKAVQQRQTCSAERRGRDEGVVAMARTAGDELKQPLTVLLGMLELWRVGRFQAGDAPRVDAELQGAMEALLARVEALERAERYETKALGDMVVLDLDRARGPNPLHPN
jgi:DNA-binding response OmpR family regulator